MRILDTFVQKAGAQGVATPELPTDGAKSSDVQNILSTLSGLFGEASGVVNSFTGEVRNGKAVQMPVAPVAAPAPKSGWVMWAIIGAVALGAAWFFFKRK